MGLMGGGFIEELIQGEAVVSSNRGVRVQCGV